MKLKGAQTDKFRNDDQPCNEILGIQSVVLFLKVIGDQISDLDLSLYCQTIENILVYTL